ncbi:hypothetical protein HDE_13432 [Halotydeus destructor]|nr:hypothetical protein HDE_13432 [Halotydeus destructor]
MEAIRKKFTKKKSRPFLEDVVDEDVETGSSSVRPMVSPVEATESSRELGKDLRRNKSYGSTEATAQNVEPSAPPAEPFEDNSLVRDRSQLTRRMFSLLSAQMTWFASLAMLFVYIPHLRKIFRVNVFDKLFLTSILGYPLCALGVAGFLFFPGLRRKFAWPTLVILTACLSMVVSYIMTVGNANAFMMSVLASDACSLTAAITSFSGIDLVSRKGFLLFYPAFMVTANAAYPIAFSSMSYKDAIVPAMATTGLMTHIGYNARYLLRNRELNVKPSEYAFAVSQLYFGLSIVDAMKNTFAKQRNTTVPEGYVRI